ncbi:hypothetical protein STEG23_007177, partial [Scotinomys teguina]
YGHTVPLSDGGKAFCIIYSVIGIPFTLLFLTAVVQRVTVHVTRRPVLYFHIRWGFSKQVVAIVHAVLLGFITVSCFFFIPAAVFSVLEDDWNFLESFYFCFISLSTIGLGDYVPGEGYNQKFRELYKIGITCYLLLGLIAMLVVLETFCELHELKKFRKMFYVKKDKDEDQIHIMEHDQLSFSSITEQAAGLKEDQKQDEPFVDPQSPPYEDGSDAVEGLTDWDIATRSAGSEPVPTHSAVTNPLENSLALSMGHEIAVLEHFVRFKANLNITEFTRTRTVLKLETSRNGAESVKLWEAVPEDRVYTAVAGCVMNSFQFHVGPQVLHNKLATALDVIDSVDQ